MTTSMTPIADHFDDLHFVESNLGKPQIAGDCLRIPVKGLFPLAGHPLVTQTPRLVSGILRFEGVVSSTRTLIEYVGDPKNPSGFKDRRQEQDGPFPASDATDIREFLFAGYGESPPAWIEHWVVRARRFVLEVDNQ